MCDASPVDHFPILVKPRLVGWPASRPSDLEEKVSRCDELAAHSTHSPHKTHRQRPTCMCVCMCVCVRERVCVCVCECECV